MKVFILFEREAHARDVQIFATRAGAEAEKQRVITFEAINDIKPFARSVMFIEEREVK